MMWFVNFLFTGLLGGLTYWYFSVGYVQLTLILAGITVVYFLTAPAFWGVANWLRKLAAPSLYTTRGFFDALGKRFFWTYGPQCWALLFLFCAALFVLTRIEADNQSEKRELISQRLKKMQEADQSFAVEKERWSPSAANGRSTGIFELEMVVVGKENSAFWISADRISEQKWGQIRKVVNNPPLDWRNKFLPNLAESQYSAAVTSEILFMLNTLDSKDGKSWGIATAKEVEQAKKTGRIEDKLDHNQNPSVPKFYLRRTAEM